MESARSQRVTSFTGVNAGAVGKWPASVRVAAAAVAVEGERAPRNSGGKRDLDAAAATDAVNAVRGGPAGTGAPAKKAKVTYQLPHQNMEEGHFHVVLGEDVDVSTGRFKMLSLLGEGTFGKVVEAWDRKRKEYCAVKIVRNVPKYSRDAKIEIAFMERVSKADPSDRFPVTKIDRHFSSDQGHVCIVMRRFGPCLLEWLQRHGPLPARQLAEVAFLAGCALDFLHSDLRLMHTDLKPENMLLESGVGAKDAAGRTVPAQCKVRLCDLGGCCDERHSRSAIVSTRHYRSPEVILGLGWMFSTDMWSMGCILYELATGKLLFDTHDNLEHLHLMERAVGRLPADWASRASEDTRSLFTAQGHLRSCSDPRHAAKIARCRPLGDAVDDELLSDLLCGLLRYDRSRRTTARQLCTHPFVMRHYPEAGDHPLHPSNRGPLQPSPTA